MFYRASGSQWWQISHLARCVVPVPGRRCSRMWPFRGCESWLSVGYFGVGVVMLGRYERQMAVDLCWSCAWSGGELQLHSLFRWHILRVVGYRGRDGLKRNLVDRPGDDVTRHGAVEVLSLVPQMLADATALTVTSTASRTTEFAMMVNE